MPILRTLIDKFVVRATQDNKYESEFLRRYFKKQYGISVGLYSVGCFDRWRIPPGTTIGRYCSIAASARLIDANHPIASLSTHPYFYLAEFGLTPASPRHVVPPIVEDDVWMSHNSIATPECKRIGRGSIIGAGSTVMSDVPRYAIMTGAPARLVRFRFTPDVIDAIESTEWWLLDKDELKRGLDQVPDFLSRPSVESAEAFLRSLGRQGKAAEKRDHRRGTETGSDASKELKVSTVASDGIREEKLYEVIRSEIPAFSPDQVNLPFDRLNIDSLGLLNLRTALEQHLGERISDKKWGDVLTPTDLLQLGLPTAPIPTPFKNADRVGGQPAAEVRPAVKSAARGAATELYWLPKTSDLERDLKSLDASSDKRDAWRRLLKIAGSRLDFTQVNRVDRAIQRHFAGAPPEDLATQPIRLAVLASSTLTHLLPAIRVGGLRRGLFVTTYEGPYGQYLQELANPTSDLFAFRPNVILLAFDAHHLARGINVAANAKESEAELKNIVLHVRQCWRMARDANIPLIQQTALPIFLPILGSNEHRLPESRLRFITRLNELFRQAAEEEGVDLLAIDSCASGQGIETWHDPVLWNRAKQEISPVAAPLYGDLVARLLAAQQGRSFKCMVFDLDNTLWGGVIGDDGLDGIVLGQGDPTGEAFLELHNYAVQQTRRGVILAVCSKNDEANALAPFEQHPEMILKRSDIACFVANWDDKAKNIRRIASELNIGLDSLVFVDDNPFERNLVRSALPMVAVPELPDEPALFARTISDAGYFEGIRITDEDRSRARQYEVNAERSALLAESADLPTYLRSLDMKLFWKGFDNVGLQRIVQLINKTNQFNLTTRRYNEAEIHAIMGDPDSFGLQLRLVDRYGDNGVIAIVIGKRRSDELVIDTWLMSCRVLGRQIEEAILGLVVEAAAKLGTKRIIGEYIPTAKNAMVKDHYSKLGFTFLESLGGGGTRWKLDPQTLAPPELYATLVEG